MSCEDALENAVRERQREGVAANESGFGNALAGDLEHSFALIEPDYLAREVSGQKAGPAGDVEGVSEGKRGQRPPERRQLPLPAGPLALAEQAATEVPVVVLRRACVVVLPHAT